MRPGASVDAPRSSSNKDGELYTEAVRIICEQSARTDLSARVDSVLRRR